MKVDFKAYFPKGCLPKEVTLVDNFFRYCVYYIISLFITFKVCDKLNVSDNVRNTFLRWVALPIFGLLLLTFVVLVLLTVYHFVFRDPVMMMPVSGYVYCVIDNEELVVAGYDNSRNTDSNSEIRLSEFYDLFKKIRQHSTIHPIFNFLMKRCIFRSVIVLDDFYIVESNNKRIILDIPDDINYPGSAQIDFIIENNFSSYNSLRAFIEERGRFDDRAVS